MNKIAIKQYNWDKLMPKQEAQTTELSAMAYSWKKADTIKKASVRPRHRSADTAAG